MNNELGDISVDLSKMQKDIKSIAEKINRRYHDAGLTDAQIEKILGVDDWIIRNIVNRYEQGKEDKDE